MDDLLRHLQTRKWKGTYSRANIVPPEDKKWTKWSMKSKKAVLSEYIGCSGEAYDLIAKVAPDIEPGWQVTLNKNIACAPHVDKYQTVNHILLLGSFEAGGELCCDDGTRTAEKGTWHTIDPRQTHWVEPWASGDRFSVVVFYKPQWQLDQWEAHKQRGLRRDTTSGSLD